MNELLKALSLKHVEKGLPELCEQARMHSLTYDAFLRRVLVMEIEGRKQAAQEKRLKAAKLPTRKTLEAFDFAFQPSIDDRQVWNWLISPLSKRTAMWCFWVRRALGRRTWPSALR